MEVIQARPLEKSAWSVASILLVGCYVYECMLMLQWERVTFATTGKEKVAMIDCGASMCCKETHMALGSSASWTSPLRMYLRQCS